MSVVHSQSHSVAMTVISANVEGVTASKASILSVMCNEQHCHCLCLQETHRSMVQAKPWIPGIALVAERPHKRGSTVFIRDGLKVNNISVCEEGNVELITVELFGVIVHSMYKPPPEPFRLPALGQTTCHSYTTRNYRNHSTVQYGKKIYNPDLIFVFSNISDMCEKLVLDPIPRTQHRPIGVTVNPIIVPQPTTSRRRFNLKKANWDGFSTEFHAAINYYVCCS